MLIFDKRDDGGIKFIYLVILMYSYQKGIALYNMAAREMLLHVRYNPEILTHHPA